jgi:hypothetical protein
MLAVIATATAIAPSTALARFDESMPDHPPTAPHVVQHDAGGSTDWTLIGVGAAGGIALLGAGTVKSRHMLRRTAGVGAASGS